jgi:transposase-like protein
METLTTNKESGMTCETCGVSCKRFGKHRNGLQRFRCATCGKTYTEEHKAAFRVEDYLKTKQGIMALKVLVEVALFAPLSV